MLKPQAALFMTYLLVGSLFALIGLKQYLFDPLSTTGRTSVWFAMQVMPLLLPLPGVLRGSVRAIFILCLVSMLYFAHGVTLVFDPDLRMFGAFEILFALGLCTVTALYVRNAPTAQS